MNKGPVKSNQSEEDYLESILLLSGKVPFVHRIEVAKRMGVSQAAVNKAVKLLCERNYVYEDGKHLYLTEEGREYASAVYEKHCIIREFFYSARRFSRRGGGRRVQNGTSHRRGDFCHDEKERQGKIGVLKVKNGRKSKLR